MTPVDRLSVVVALVLLWASVLAVAARSAGRMDRERRLLCGGLTAVALTVTADRGYAWIGAATGVANLALLLEVLGALAAAHLLLGLLRSVHDGPRPDRRAVLSRRVLPVAVVGTVVLWALGPATVPDAYATVHVVSDTGPFLAWYLWIGLWGAAYCCSVVRLAWLLAAAARGTPAAVGVAVLGAGTAVVLVRVVAEYVVLGVWTFVVGREAARPLYEPVSDLSTAAMYACGVLATGPLLPPAARWVREARRRRRTRSALRELAPLRDELLASLGGPGSPSAPPSGDPRDSLYRVVIDIHDALLATPASGACAGGGPAPVRFAPFRFESPDFDGEVSRLRMVARSRDGGAPGAVPGAVPGDPPGRRA